MFSKHDPRVVIEWLSKLGAQNVTPTTVYAKVDELVYAAVGYKFTWIHFGLAREEIFVVGALPVEVSESRVTFTAYDAVGEWRLIGGNYSEGDLSYNAPQTDYQPFGTTFVLGRV